MKEPKKTAKSGPVKTLVPAKSGSGFPGWLVEKIRLEYADETHPECAPLSSFSSMFLTDQLKRRFKNPPWSIVDHVVRTLDPGDFNSFAILSGPETTFVQCLCGVHGWHLEWRITGTAGAYVHYRACHHGGSHEPYFLEKTDCVNEGERRDLVQVDHVLHAFRAFHQGQGMPTCLDWRVIDV